MNIKKEENSKELKLSLDGRLDTTTAPRGHWVGDGFPVRSLFSHMSGENDNTPFLMLDYGGPHEFAPAAQPRGVGVHPHKGFETVTIVYQGEVEHGDSTGRGGSSARLIVVSGSSAADSAA